MTIRRLVPTDASEYRELMLQAYADSPDAFTSTVAERGALPLTWWEERLEENSPTTLILGAFLEGRMVGTAGFQRETRERSLHKTILFGVFVKPEHRGSGLGRKLVEEMIEEARAIAQVRLMQLTVSHTNQTARELYQRCGFTEFGIEPLAIAVESGYVDKVHMWMDLR